MDREEHQKAVEEGIADAEAGHLVDLESVNSKLVARAELRKSKEAESHDS